MVTGNILFAFAGTLLFLQMYLPSRVIDRPLTNDPFVLAQYYFNADDDPDGPYDIVKARYYYEQAILANPRAYDSAWYQLARIDFLEGRFNNAIYKFEKQLEYFKDVLPQAHYMLGLTYAYRAKEGGGVEDWDAAAKEFEQFLRYKPYSPWARTDLSWIYFAQGKYEEMLPVLEKGLEYTPDSPWLHNMYGLALMNTGDREGAREHFEQASISAAELSIEEWGLAYPGNDPSMWEVGLASFRAAIEENLQLSHEG